MKRPILFFVIGLLVVLSTAVSCPVASQETRQPEKIFCPNCGLENQTTGKFCSACGTRLPDRIAVTSLAENEMKQSNGVIVANAESSALETSRAQTLCDTAFQMIDVGNYAAAAKFFRQIMQEYPSSEYAKESAYLARACEKLAVEGKASEPKPTQKAPAPGAAFGGAFMGSFLGAVGGILVLVLLANGG